MKMIYMKVYYKIILTQDNQKNKQNLKDNLDLNFYLVYINKTFGNQKEEEQID